MVRLRCLLPLEDLEGADAVMLVYDLTNANSFENVEDWMDLVNTQFAGSNNKPHIALVGNKRDVSHLRVCDRIPFQAVLSGILAISSYLPSALCWGSLLLLVPPTLTTNNPPGLVLLGGYREKARRFRESARPLWTFCQRENWGSGIH